MIPGQSLGSAGGTPAAPFEDDKYGDDISQLKSESEISPIKTSNNNSIIKNEA